MICINFKNLAINFGYSIGSNLLSLFISIFVTLVIPKIIGVQEYGYWQLYIFYSTYAGFSHFGWADGVYLRFGGAEYENLDKKIFFSQFLMYVSNQLIISFITFIIIFLNVKSFDSDSFFIILATLVTMIIVNTQFFLNFILQATNRFKESSIITVIERVIYLFGIFILLFTFNKNYKMMIIFDILGKTISLIYAMYICKDIVRQPISNFKFTWNETKNNILSGSKLLYSNLASQMIVGVSRFGIERQWGITTFGKISLTLSISNLFMVFVSALGNVIYPVLRKISIEKLSNFYNVTRNVVSVFSFGLLVLYYPIKVVLVYWLPQYELSLNYMGILLPIVVFESRVSLLLNPLLKALRRENEMVRLNLVSLIISAILTIFGAFIIQNIDFTVFAILVTISIRSLLGEIVISRVFNLNLVTSYFYEFFLVTIFICSAWYLDSILTLYVYFSAYLLYLILNFGKIRNSFKILFGYFYQ